MRRRPRRSPTTPPRPRQASPRRSTQASGGLAHENHMSSTSLFAELLKKTKNRDRVMALMTKESDKPEKGKENVEPEAGGSASGPDTPGPVPTPTASVPSTTTPVAVTAVVAATAAAVAAAAVAPNNINSNNTIIPFTTTTTAVPAAVATAIPNGASLLETSAVIDLEENSDQSCPSEQPPPSVKSETPDIGKIDFKKVTVPTSLTKLPMPPGINLEDIDSPTSPSTPPETKPTRKSIITDLPMPPSKTCHFTGCINV